LLHDASVGPKDHVCDEDFTVEERIFYENIEVLNDFSYDIPSTESSDIISDTSVLLDVHKDQHVSFENYEFIEQMLSIVDGSPGYRVEADVPSIPAYDDEDLLVFKEEMVVEEDFSLFLQEVSHDIFLPRIKEKNIMCEHPDAAGTTIPEMDIELSHGPYL
jgi:transcriptional regulator of NAD metabolism